MDTGWIFLCGVGIRIHFSGWVCVYPIHPCDTRKIVPLFAFYVLGHVTFNWKCLQVTSAWTDNTQ